MIPHEARQGYPDGDSDWSSGDLPHPAPRQDIFNPDKVMENLSTVASSLLDLWDDAGGGGGGGRRGGGGGGAGSANETFPVFDTLCDEDRDPFCMFSSGLNETSTDMVNTSGTPNGVSEDTQHYRYWALVLAVFPLVTVFGNVLVVMSVVREKSLKTVTNYFICSLAVADIMVAVVVMPLAVYVEVVEKWGLSDMLCDAWVASDVLACTASILNLTAISVDRFIAVTQPIKYAKHKNSKRVNITIALTWISSVAISMPIALGVNYTEHRVPGECAFFNADFIIYSSMGSFYIPSLIMIFLYSRIYRVIRERALKARAAKLKALKSRTLQNVIENPAATAGGGGGGVGGGVGGGGNGTISSTTVATFHPSMTTSLAQVDNGRVTTYNTTTPTTTLSHHLHHHHHLLTELPQLEETSITNMPSRSDSEDDDEDFFEEDDFDDEDNIKSNTTPSQIQVEPTLTCQDGELGAELISNPGAAAAEKREGGGAEVGKASDRKVTPRSDAASVRKKPGKGGKNNGSVGAAGVRHKKGITKFHFHKRSSRKRKEKSSSRKEKKATKTLAIVLGVFLLCWVPFFTINIINAICIRYSMLNYPTCNPPKLIFSLFVWLGYINSFLNPVIYTIFNPEFRKAFKKILTEPCACCR